MSKAQIIPQMGKKKSAINDIYLNIEVHEETKVGENPPVVINPFSA
jgi:hypothetical protein